MSYPGYPHQQQHYPHPHAPPQQPPFYGHGAPPQPPQGYPPPQQYAPPHGYPQQSYQQPAPPYPLQHGAPPHYSAPQELPTQYHQPSFPPAHHQPGFPPPQHQHTFPAPQHQPTFPPHQPSFAPPQHQPSFGLPQHQPTFSSPPAYSAHHAPPVLNVASEIFSIHKAMRGFGTDEKTLIQILSSRDGATIDAIRRGYGHSHGDLVKALQKEASGHFRLVLTATALGAGAEAAAFWAHKAVAGAGTNEPMLNEAVLCRSNAELVAMKEAYRTMYGRALDADVKGDLSLKTREMFEMVLEARRSEEFVPADPAQAMRDVQAIRAATKTAVCTEAITVCRIVTKANEAQIRALVYEYQRAHGLALQDVVKHQFSGHMKDALLFIIDGAVDAVKRDAELLEAAMKGFGTKDELLVMRVVRCHWNRIYMESVKNRYLTIYGKSLADRIKGETSGHYRDMLLALVA